jgi:dTDP-4-amino-4,6-dideoxygalactose transaminase
MLPTGNLDINSVAQCVSEKTKAIIVLHYAGNAGNIIQLLDFCKSKGLYLIEDAAQCIGSTFDNKPLGCFGHIGCLSFDYMKNVTCGQGGLLIVNDKKFLRNVQTIYDNGTNKYALLNGEKNYFEWVGKGSNCQMNPLASHFLFVQLMALELITKNRVAKWNLYYQMLLPLMEEGKIGLNNPSLTHNGHIFYLTTRSKEERDELRMRLKERSISIQHHYSSLSNSFFGKQFNTGEISLSNSEKLCNQLIRLPLWHTISSSQIETVCSEITGFYKNN